MAGKRRLCPFLPLKKGCLWIMVLRMFHVYWRTVFKPYPWHVAGIIFASLLNAITEVANLGLIVPLVAMVMSNQEGTEQNRFVVQLLQRGVNALGLAPRVEAFLFVGLLFAIVFVAIGSILALIEIYISAWISWDVSRTVRTRLFDAFLRAQYKEIVTRTRGAIVQDINGPADGLVDTIFYIAQGLSASLHVAAITLFALYLSRWITLTVGALAIAGFFLTRLALDWRTRWVGRQLYELRRGLDSMLVESIDGIRVIKIGVIEKTALMRFRALLDRQHHLAVRSILLLRCPTPIIDIASVVLLAALVGVILRFPNSGLTMPVLVAFVATLHRISAGVSLLNSSISALNQKFRQVEMADKVLQSLPLESSEGNSLSDQPVERIQLEKITFGYAGRDTVLREVSLEFKRGQVTALVGGSGVGKTTIADLVVRLYEPDTGHVLVNGRDVANLNLADWRRRIGYVGQDVFLFNASIRDNIALWSEGVSRDAIENAARASKIHDFIMTLPEQYQTTIGERGLKLSGGQRQRVAIARAVLHRPDVLIFDEATSSLDNITEREVRLAVSHLRSDAIVILVAHRLSTVVDADQIIVLKHGDICEQGTHDQLLQAGGEYWNLYQHPDSSHPETIVLAAPETA